MSRALSSMMQRSHVRGVSPSNSVASSGVSELSAMTRSRFSAVSPSDSPTETPLPQPEFDGNGEQQPSHPLASSAAHPTELTDHHTPGPSPASAPAPGARTSCPAMTSTTGNSNYSNSSGTRSASQGQSRRGAVRSQSSFMECTSTTTLVAAAGSAALCSGTEQVDGTAGGSGSGSARPRTRTSSTRSSCNAIGIDGGVLLADSFGSSSGASGPAPSTLRERVRNNSEPALFALLTNSSTQASAPPTLPIVQQPRSIASATNATAAIVPSD